MIISLIVFGSIGLVIILAAIWMVFYLTTRRKGVERASQRAQELIDRQDSAVWASATILSMQGGLITGEHAGVASRARYDLSLEVTPPGGEPYHARTAWLVEVAWISMLQPGQQLSVRIDQQDPMVIYPNASWAKYIPG